MSDREALLRDILENPEDDAPRLIFADYIDERGEPERAEFIRVQIDLAKIRAYEYVEDCDPKRHYDSLVGVGYGPETAPKWKELADLSDGIDVLSLRRRERELFAGSGPKWWDDLPGKYRATIENTTIESACGKVFRVRRGFVDSITCTAADCLAHLDSILAAQPVREVTLTTWPEVHSGPGNSVRIRDLYRDFLDFCTVEDARQYRMDHPGSGLLEAKRRLMTPHLLAAEWPRIKTWNLPPLETPEFPNSAETLARRPIRSEYAYSTR